MSDGEKKSWREIDRMRDNPSARRERTRSRPGRPDRSSERYKSLLERAFEKGELGRLAEALSEAAPEPVPGEAPKSKKKGPNRQKLLYSIKNEPVPKKARKLLEEFVEHFGFPEDVEALVVGLDHSDETFVLQVLDKLREVLSADKPRRTGTLRAKLRLLADDFATPDEVRERALEVLDLL